MTNARDDQTPAGGHPRPATQTPAEGHPRPAMPVWIAYAHPIGEEADVFWTAVGRTPEEARARIEAKIRESLVDDYAEDLDDASFWVLLIDEDTL